MRRAAAALLLGCAATPACSEPPQPKAPVAARTPMAAAPSVTLSHETPRAEIAVPAAMAAPRALAVRLEPAAGGPGFGVEVWLAEPGGERRRLGAVAPFPAGEPGEFLIAWPKGMAPPAAGSRLQFVLQPAAPQDRPSTRLSVSWR